MITSGPILNVYALFSFVLLNISAGKEPILPTEKIELTQVWVDPKIDRFPGKELAVTVWFEDQFLGDGNAYLRRTKELSGTGRTLLRKQVEATLKSIAQKSQNNAAKSLEKLQDKKAISQLDYHWVINGFSCQIRKPDIKSLAKVPGVKMIYLVGAPTATPVYQKSRQLNKAEATAKTPQEFKTPWYIKSLKVDQVWDEFGITGKGVLNVVHDSNFITSAHILHNRYQNPAEKNNNKDDSGNGLIDDLHGYNFAQANGNLLRIPFNTSSPSSRNLHGHQCVAIICGRETQKHPYRMGLAPDSKWAGIIARNQIETAIEWAIEQGADTYSMSFSRPGLGELRSHWRKIMEHATFCGIHFVSGAGNFAQKGRSSYAPIPVQMRTPEDIPNVVFAAAGVQRNLERTIFSSQGPVKWQTTHYQDGKVDKPEVAAFNYQIPQLLPNEQPSQRTTSGNSFAGPMFCGTIALILSANPDLNPWQVREIILSTAIDIGPKGFDHQTGFGLIDAKAAVQKAMKPKK